MKPPTLEALRYASVVLGRDVTQLERLLQHHTGHRESDPARMELESQRTEQLGELLSHVRTVRTWILGVQMPIAQRREARTEPQCETWIHDSSEDESHGPECHCSECSAAPIMPSDLSARFLRTGFKLANALNPDLTCTCEARGMVMPGTLHAFTCPQRQK